MLTAQQCWPEFFVHMCTHTEYVHRHALSCENLDKWTMAWRASHLSHSCLSLLLIPLSVLCPLRHLLFCSPRHFTSLISTLSCPLLLYLLLFCNSTCPRRVHLSDPVTLAAGRQIASTPSGLSIALLSASVDQIALTVYQQTKWDSRLHSHERTHKQHTNTADNYITVTAISHHNQLLYPCAITLFTLCRICVLAVSCSCLRLVDEALDQRE